MILFTSWLPENNIGKWYKEILDCKQQFTQLYVTQFGLLCNLRSIAWHARYIHNLGQNKWKFPPAQRTSQREGNVTFWPSLSFISLIFEEWGWKGYCSILFCPRFSCRFAIDFAYPPTSSFFSKIVELANYTSVRENRLPCWSWRDVTFLVGGDFRTPYYPWSKSRPWDSFSFLRKFETK